MNIDLMYRDVKTGEFLEKVSIWNDYKGEQWAWFKTREHGAMLDMFQSDVVSVKEEMFKLQLKFQIANVKDEDDNACCPKCLDHWNFDEDYAWYTMTEKAKQQLTEQKYLHVVCEDCEHSVDLDEFLELLNQYNVYTAFATEWED